MSIDLYREVDAVACKHEILGTKVGFYSPLDNPLGDWAAPACTHAVGVFLHKRPCERTKCAHGQRRAWHIPHDSAQRLTSTVAAASRGWYLLEVTPSPCTGCVAWPEVYDGFSLPTSPHVTCTRRLLWLP